MQILRNLEARVESIIIIIVFCILSMLAYAATSDEPPPKRKKSMFAGGVIALILSYPTWMAIGRFIGGDIDAFWLIPITFTYTVTGQFIPEFLQNVVPKAAKKIFNIFFKRTTGEDMNNDN